jgi:hypothetical protein
VRGLKSSPKKLQKIYEPIHDKLFFVIFLGSHTFFVWFGLNPVALRCSSRYNAQQGQHATTRVLSQGEFTKKCWQEQVISEQKLTRVVKLFSYFFQFFIKKKPSAIFQISTVINTVLFSKSIQLQRYYLKRIFVY